MPQYFVTEKFLKTYGMITDNVDVTDFSPLIQNAAKAFIKPMIGSYFFNDLLTKYNNQTLTVDESKVVEIMQFSIAWRATAEAGVSLSYQLKNKGYQTQSGDNSEAVEDKVVWKMYDHYIQKSFVFEQELKNYLTLNKNSFPEFISDLNKDSSIKGSCTDNGTTYNYGIGLMVI
jgi:hypothetical protein